MTLYYKHKAWGQREVSIRCTNCKYRSVDLSIPCCPKCQSTKFNNVGFFVCSIIQDKIIEMINGNEYYSTEILAYIHKTYWPTCTTEQLRNGILKVVDRITRNDWPCKEINPNGTPCIHISKKRHGLTLHLQTDHDNLTMTTRKQTKSNKNKQQKKIQTTTKKITNFFKCRNRWVRFFREQEGSILWC
eukprot:441493_1